MHTATGGDTQSSLGKKGTDCQNDLETHTPNWFVCSHNIARVTHKNGSLILPLLPSKPSTTLTVQERGRWLHENSLHCLHHSSVNIKLF
jgi:hypothetical protein